LKEKAKKKEEKNAGVDAMDVEEVHSLLFSLCFTIYAINIFL
jgi:hypothetical protein